MANIQMILNEFLKAQNERLQERTFREYEEVIEMFQVYLNGYAHQYLDNEDMQKFKEQYETDEESFIKIFGYDKIDLATYSDFFEYFIIRKVMAGESFMKKAVRVIKKLTKWLKEKKHIDDKQYNDLIEFFDDGHAKALPNAEKVADLIYDLADQTPEREYFGELLEGYFTIIDIKSQALWVDDMLGGQTNIGPVVVTEQIAKLCQEGWDLSLVIGKYQDKWHILESGNVYPVSY